ncbi:MAG: redoxin domain-containing protein [Methanomassiliicoccales archaeon]|nr:MAG: redoxin domain-containing protein [Methanomassiliicoccales archaeon]
MNYTKLLRGWILIGIIICLLLPLPNALAESNIKTVRHTPQNPEVDQVITVFVDINDTTNISKVSLLYCQIEPSYLCYTPLEMTLDANDNYTASITQNLEGITRLGYNITILYDNGSKEYSPEEGTYHYLNITGGEDKTPPSPAENLLALQVLGGAIIVVLVFLILRHVRNKKKATSGNKKLTVVLVAIFLILSGAAVILFFLGQESGEIEEAPDFTLADIDGNTFNLTDFRGQVVLLDMMSIPCESCKIVEKDLKDIYPEYKDEVVFISIDILADDTDEMLRDYRVSHDIEWTIARDTDEIILKYSSEAIPKIVIIDADGYATYEHTGTTDKSELKSELDRAISGEAQAISITEASLFSLAIFAGIASFFSPCAFPMLPGYIAYYLRKDVEAGGKIPMKRAALSGTISATGIIIVYLIIGIIMVFAGTSIEEYTAFFTLIVGIILIALGVLMFTPLQYWKIVRPFQNLWARLKGLGKKKSKEKEGKETDSITTGASEPGFYSGLFLYGLGYGAAAAGCTAPLFIAVVLAAMAIGSFLMGILILILYTVTAALLMLAVTMAIAYFGAGAAQKLSKHTEKIKKISGAVLVVVGVYLIWFYLAAAG